MRKLQRTQRIYGSNVLVIRKREHEKTASCFKRKKGALDLPISRTKVDFVSGQDDTQLGSLPGHKRQPKGANAVERLVKLG